MPEASECWGFVGYVRCWRLPKEVFVRICCRPSRRRAWIEITASANAAYSPRVALRAEGRGLKLDFPISPSRKPTVALRAEGRGLKCRASRRRAGGAACRPSRRRAWIEIPRTMKSPSFGASRPSRRRAWIEINISEQEAALQDVALRAEGRGLKSPRRRMRRTHREVALRAEGRGLKSYLRQRPLCVQLVALRAEGRGLKFCCGAFKRCARMSPFAQKGVD